jgi:uncharacterized protein (UPF0147 family)
MFDAVATQDAIDLLETIIADPEVPDNARFILTRALNRLDHELRGELVTRQTRSEISKSRIGTRPTPLIP